MKRVLISREWAEQLLFLSRGIRGEERVNKVVFIPDGYHEYVVALDDFTFSWEALAKPDDRVWMPRFEREHITLSKYWDPINMEITHLGYGGRSKTLVVGTTYQVQGPGAGM